MRTAGKAAKNTSLKTSLTVEEGGKYNVFCFCFEVLVRFDLPRKFFPFYRISYSRKTHL